MQGDMRSEKYLSSVQHLYMWLLADKGALTWAAILRLSSYFVLCHVKYDNGDDEEDLYKCTILEVVRILCSVPCQVL